MILENLLLTDMTPSGHANKILQVFFDELHVYRQQ